MFEQVFSILLFLLLLVLVHASEGGVLMDVVHKFISYQI